MRPKLVLLAVVLLGALHQDFWLWTDAALLFGFVPYGLAYHVAFSLVTAGLWGVVVRSAWPSEPHAEIGELSDGQGPKR